MFGLKDIPDPIQVFCDQGDDKSQPGPRQNAHVCQQWIAWKEAVTQWIKGNNYVGAIVCNTKR